MLTKRHTVALATASLALLLAGCSGGGGTTSSAPAGESAPPAAADQSKTEACTVVQKSLTEFSSINSQLDPSNPQAAVDAFKKFTTTTSESLNAITNTEVKDAATQAATALDDYVAFLETIVADPSKASDISTQITALQEGFTKVATVCGS